MITNVSFIKFPTIDGRDIAINIERIDAIEDKGKTIKVALGVEWIEINITLEDFISKCNAIGK